jgi:AcrR family transcriptional regulator
MTGTEHTSVNIDSISGLIPPKSVRGRARRERILKAATELFLENGYGETSMDAIVERSGGSKATLYSYFPSKEDLFRAVIDAIVLHREEPALEPSGDIRAALVGFALQRMAVVFSSQHCALLRLIVGERERFPDIARMYYERGPRRSKELLADYMATLRSRNLLAIDDAAESAELLVGMLFFEWYLTQLYLAEGPPSEKEMQARTERVVDRFIEAFHK